jgi:hypothetical protein
MAAGFDNGLFVNINIAAVLAIHPIPHRVNEDDPVAVQAIGFTQLRRSMCG